MDIVVCIKQVPDTAEVRIDPQTNNLMRLGVPGVINPFDKSGIEMALKLRAQTGGTVTALCMGLEQASKELEYCMSLGADRAILLTDRRLGGSDTLATGYALAETIAKIGYDLIICGLEAVDGCTGQVGPSIAEHLGIPQFTYVSQISPAESGGIRVTRDTQDYIEEYFAPLPALVCVHKSVLTSSLGRTDRRAELWNADHLDEELIGLNGSPTRVMRVAAGARSTSYVDVDPALSSEQRIDFIMSGGVQQKKPRLMRGSDRYAAELILGGLSASGAGENTEG